MKGAETSKHFAGANEKAKLVKTMANLVRRARLDYEAFRRVCAQVRRVAGLRRPPRSRRLMDMRFLSPEQEGSPRAH